MQKLSEYYFMWTPSDTSLKLASPLAKSSDDAMDETDRCREDDTFLLTAYADSSASENSSEVSLQQRRFSVPNSDLVSASLRNSRI